MEQGAITITAEGSVRFLNNEVTAALTTPSTIVRRASHVEPHGAIMRAAFHSLRFLFGEKGLVSDFTRLWPCRWRVNLAPAGGPILLQRWYNRKDAIKAEIVWLNRNFI
jgi:hypothetical protein